MLIKVTEEDITTGCPMSDTHCPIAYSLYRNLPEIEEISVGSIRVHLDEKCVYLPNSAREFIKKFDREEMVEPFEFELEIP